MSSRLPRIAERIQAELVDLEIILGRITMGWDRVYQSGDDYYLDGVALNLHSFYSAIERVFELVATMIDGYKPQGENWHLGLMLQMNREVPEIRPVVISDQVVNDLQEFRGFYQMVRDVYTIHYDPIKVERLVKQAPIAFQKLRTELLTFADFLNEN
jgi:hypothetical protein